MKRSFRNSFICLFILTVVLLGVNSAKAWTSWTVLQLEADDVPELISDEFFENTPAPQGLFYSYSFITNWTTAFYINEDLSFYEGWKTIDGEKYYFQPNRKDAATAWYFDEESKKNYRFSSSGILIAEKMDPEAAEKLIGSDNEQKGLIMISDSYYLSYGPEDTWKVVTKVTDLGSGLFKIGGDIFCNDETVSSTDGWKTLNGSTYYFVGGKPVQGPYKIGNDLYIFKMDGTLAKNEFVSYTAADLPFFTYRDPLFYDTSFYGDEKGVFHTGWQEINGKYYYFHSNGMICGYGIVKLGQYYVFDENYALVTDPGWYDFTGNYPRAGFPLEGRVYVKEDTTLYTGWLNLDGEWYHLGPVMAKSEALFGYYFDSEGRMFQGENEWVNDAGYWIYLQENSSPAKDWKEIDGKWYYFDGDCHMTIGWLSSGNNWYYFDSDGHMVTGWIQIEDNWYYFDDNGKMQTGWLQLGSDWYYFDQSGKMASGKVTIDGIDNVFSSAGVWQGYQKTGWNQENGSWYYYDEAGNPATGWQQIDGTWYYFNGKGIMKTGWLEISSSEWYWFNDAGVMATGWKEINGQWEFFDQNGVWQYSWDGE